MRKLTKFLLSLIISSSAAQAELPNAISSQELNFDTKVNNLPSGDFKILDIRNEFPHSIKLVLEADRNNKREIYLHAYEIIKGLTIPNGINYKVQVYDSQGVYKGYLRNTDTLSMGTIQVSPFLLTKDYVAPKETGLEGTPVLSFNSKREELIDNTGVVLPKNSVDEIMVAIDGLGINKKEISKPEPPIIQTIAKTLVESKGMLNTDLLTPYKEYKKTKTTEEKTSTDSSPRIKAEEVQELKTTLTSKIPIQEPEKSNKRKIKVSNLTAETIELSINKAGLDSDKPAWTLSSEDYSPQYLKVDDQIIEIDDQTNISITGTQSKTQITKYSGDLNIDERGNYVLVIEDLK